MGFLGEKHLASLCQSSRGIELYTHLCEYQKVFRGSTCSGKNTKDRFIALAAILFANVAPLAKSPAERNDHQKRLQPIDRLT